MSGVNWKTTNNHIIYFIGKGYAKEVYSNIRIKIYKITDEGRKFLYKN